MILDIKGTIIAKTTTDDIEKVRTSIREGLRRLSYGRAKIAVNPSGDILVSGWLGWLSWWFITDGRITANQGSQKRIIVTYHLASSLADILFVFALIAMIILAVRIGIGILIAYAVIVLFSYVVIRGMFKRRFEFVIKRQIAKI